MARILVIRDEEWERLQRYANQKGVSGGWQNLCRKLILRETHPDDVDEKIKAVQDQEGGLFGNAPRAQQLKCPQCGSPTADGTLCGECSCEDDCAP